MRARLWATTVEVPHPVLDSDDLHAPSNLPFSTRPSCPKFAISCVLSLCSHPLGVGCPVARGLLCTIVRSLCYIFSGCYTDSLAADISPR